MASIMTEGDRDRVVKRWCGLACHRAKRPVCRCCCGGVYHGFSRKYGRDPFGVLDRPWEVSCEQHGSSSTVQAARAVD